MVRQRVYLLSQELTQSLSRVPGNVNRGKGEAATPLQTFLARRITNPTAASGSLLGTLLGPNSVPPIGSSDPIVSLYTLSASNAIEAARVATANATKFTALGAFRGHRG